MGRHNKFFNTDIKNNSVKQKANYSRPLRDNELDRNDPIVKSFLIILGLACLIGVIYYIVLWFNME